ncbi:MAG TPA: histidine kinase [Flavobacteriales bacterium]|nr:histidine kinase [Flavobacteriales bacterium]
MGEEQFKGVQVYDIIQDHHHNYWFGTNEGLFYYDFNAYYKVECDAAKGNSVFNFVINKEGTVYCHNLNNQVFELKNGQCKLFYELKKDESRPDVSLEIADNDCLVIGAASIIVLNKKGVVINKQVLFRHFLGPSFITPRKAVQFHLNSTDSIIVYANSVFTKHKLNISGKPKGDFAFKFFSDGTSTFAMKLDSKDLFSYNTKNLVVKPLPGNSFFSRLPFIRIYETKNKLWVASTLPGVRLVNQNINQSEVPVWYENYFISGVFQDHEGNILLATFDKGILVIPDLKIPDVINDFREDPATAVYGDKDLGLVMGTSKGVLTSYRNSAFNQINGEGSRPIEVIYGEVFSDLLIFDDGCIRAYNKRTRTISNIVTASLKDAAIVSNNLFYLGTNRGILKVLRDGKNNFSLAPLKDMRMRIYSMEFDPVSGNLYASTSSGFFCIDSVGKCAKITHKQKDIFPFFLYCNQGKIYVGTPNNGILVIENDKITGSILPKVDGKPISLRKIVIYKNSIIAKSANKIFQFDMNGNRLKSIHALFGFSSKRVIDFAFFENKLWVSHTGGVQEIDLNYLKLTSKPQNLRFNRILVNDKVLNDFREGDFTYDQRKFEFVFSSPTIKNRENIQYYYKLSGYDTKWNLASFESNKILYNALAPGSYTLKLKGESHGLFTNELSYAFTIASPFYAKWWFIALVVVLFLLVVWLVYRWQLNRQRKKSAQINELNASKLTAIQSQMNPHFIFNSLNSIQDLILKGDVEHSYSYITTFSNLVRKTLNYSDKDFNDFEEEIKLLELYLSLEKLRFKKDLVYKIEKNNVEDIMLPPLLIQPFIENALVHGLLHKEGEKKLHIKFELHDVLVCTIEDNGVGREKARAIKDRQKNEHESFSSAAIHKRFEILNNVLEGQFGFAYEDLVDKNGPSGTRVTLKIPVRRKF